MAALLPGQGTWAPQPYGLPDVHAQAYRPHRTAAGAIGSAAPVGGNGMAQQPPQQPPAMPPWGLHMQPRGLPPQAYAPPGLAPGPPGSPGRFKQDVPEQPVYDNGTYIRGPPTPPPSAGTDGHPLAHLFAMHPHLGEFHPEHMYPPHPSWNAGLAYALSSREIEQQLFAGYGVMREYEGADGSDAGPQHTVEHDAYAGRPPVGDAPPMMVRGPIAQPAPSRFSGSTWGGDGMPNVFYTGSPQLPTDDRLNESFDARQIEEHIGRLLGFRDKGTGTPTPPPGRLAESFGRGDFAASPRVPAARTAGEPVGASERQNPPPPQHAQQRTHPQMGPLAHYAEGPWGGEAPEWRGPPASGQGAARATPGAGPQLPPSLQGRLALHSGASAFPQQHAPPPALSATVGEGSRQTGPAGTAGLPLQQQQRLPPGFPIALGGARMDNVWTPHVGPAPGVSHMAPHAMPGVLPPGAQSSVHRDAAVIGYAPMMRTLVGPSAVAPARMGAASPANNRDANGAAVATAHADARQHERQSANGGGTPRFEGAMPSVAGVRGVDGVAALMDGISLNDRGEAGGRFDDYASRPVTKRTPTSTHIEHVTRQMEALLTEISPTPAECSRREALFSRLQALVSRHWPNATLHVYGSSANNFGLKNCDMDICLMNDADEKAQATMVKKLARMLRKDRMSDVLPLPKARVPIVKFRDPTSGICCDICINNSLALHNTRLLQTYALVDQRAVDLARVVKYWAKKRQINEPYMGTLSSYAFVLLVIYYLQTRPVPVLPCLQQIHPEGQTVRPEVKVDGYDCYFFDAIPQLRDFGFGDSVNGNSESLGDLLAGFFRYFAHDFDYHDSVVCVKTARLASKADKEWSLKNNSRTDRYWICIEDPFENTHNLGRVVDKNTLFEIRGEFMRGYRLLCDGGDLATICEPYKHSRAS